MDRVFQEYIDYYEELRPDTVENIRSLVTENFHFRDPFNDVNGVDGVVKIFHHMFTVLKDPSFKIIQTASTDSTLYVKWDFRFRHWLIGLGKEQCITGVSVVERDEAGSIAEHIDFWDASSELYARLPVLGIFFRLLRAAFS